MKKNVFFLLLLLSALYFGQNKIRNDRAYNFYENKGQILDQNGNGNPEVKYLFNSAGLNVQLRKTGFSYDVYEIEKNPQKSKDSADNTLFSTKQNIANKYNLHRVDIDFIDANKNVELLAKGKSKDFENFINGKDLDNLKTVFAYQKIIYKNLYPKIDLIFFKPNDSLKPIEYNFIINPGGKVSDIKIKFSGAESQLKDGKIAMKLRFGELQESIPKSWIEDKNSKKDIKVNYKDLGNGVFGFDSTTDTSTKKIVIDPIPTRIWGSYYGGGSVDVVGGIKTDLQNNVYVFGTTNSMNNIASAGAFQSTYSGSQSGFIAKLDTDGNRIWGSYLSSLTIRDIDFDGDLNSYITGSNAFLLKLNSSGTPLLFKFITQDGSYLDANSIVLDGEQLFFGGVLSSNEFKSGGLILKCDLQGNLIWTRVLGGYSTTAPTVINKIIVHDHSVSAIGISQISPYLIIKNPFPVTGLDSSTEPFYGVYARYSADDGTLQQSSYLNFSDYASTTNSGMPLDLKIINNTLIISGLDYVFADLKSKWVIRKFDLSTNKLISNVHFDFKPAYLYHGFSYFPVINRDLYAVSSYINDDGTVFFGGTAPGNSSYATSGAYMEETENYNQSFLVKVKNNDVLDWVTYYHGNAETDEAVITQDKNQNIYAAGNAYNNSYGIATFGTYQQTQGSVATPDLFVVKFKECIPNIPNPPKIEVCFGGTLQLNANSGTSYHWTGPNDFSSNLQNPIIQNVTSANTGDYFCTILGISECEKNIRISVFVKPEIPPVTGNSEQEFCEAEHATIASLFVTGEEVKWYDAAGNLLLPTTILVDGQTYYTTQTIDGCEGLDKFPVTVKITPNSVPANDFSFEECNDTTENTKTVNLSDFNSKIIYNNSVFTFEYFDQNNTKITDPNNVKINIGTTVFTVKVSNAFGCNKTIKLSLILNPKPTINLPASIEFCEGQNPILDAGSGFSSYYWSNNGASTQTIIATDEGLYTVKVTNSFGCENTASILVKKSVLASILSVDILNNTATVIMSTLGDFLYSLDQITWQTSNIFENLDNGNYEVFVKTQGGCFLGSKTFSIFNISNVFTPNADGKNDTWRITGLENYPNSEVSVYDNQGKRVLFKITSGAFEWDGKSNSSRLPTATYWYTIKVSDGRILNGYVLLKNRN